MIMTPGLTQECDSSITSIVKEVCEARGDCFFTLSDMVPILNPLAAALVNVFLLFPLPSPPPDFSPLKEFGVDYQTQPGP